MFTSRMGWRGGLIRKGGGNFQIEGSVLYFDKGKSYIRVCTYQISLNGTLKIYQFHYM